MSKKSTIGIVLLDAGIITINKDRCICGCCKATGRAETLSIRHKPDCTASQAVRSFIEQLHDDDHILPRVENPIELNVMLPYYSEIGKDEYTAAEVIATSMFAAATQEERAKLWPKVLTYEPSCKGWSNIKDAIIKNGLETNVDRLNMKNWLIFRKVWERNIARLEAQHYEMECEANDMNEMFRQAFGV